MKKLNVNEQKHIIGGDKPMACVLVICAYAGFAMGAYTGPCTSLQGCIGDPNYVYVITHNTAAPNCLGPESATYCSI